ncbi:lipase family protein [Sphingomonas canadensis]|uniref:Lipase family protein n=1 Tax=Sphingomonas canadensis TaxID=1219257 RepID=A0ABW3HB46_9SPHN|nr:lipase family protein [Sphingomonas canadensis]MCW3838209.1 lipase family protein [Sphingomonas canadensis]
MKRRLLFASSQAYQPRMEVMGRQVGWLERPLVIEREAAIGGRAIDLALVGRVPEGVVVAFRGTLPPFAGGYDGWAVMLDWLNDGMAACVQRSEYAGGVHLGFAESLHRLWDDDGDAPGVESAVTRMFDQSLLDRRARRHLFVTGHSKGGALANLFAFRAAQRRDWADAPLSVATIAAARAGNADFAEAYARTRIACLRYELPSDLVPHLPPGPGAPRWVRGLLRQLGSPLASHDYHPVGVQVSAPAAGPGHHQPWAGARSPSRLGWLLRRPRIGLDALIPSMFSAHAICPQSGYDQLICTGEGGCDHGAADAEAAIRPGMVPA